ncbi:MAG: ArdC family protein [bacterium]
MNVYQIITEQVISEILTDKVLPWSKPWKISGASNLITKANYKGINRFMLRTGDFWLTFNQAKAKGLSIKRGAKSNMAIFYSPTGKKKEEEDENGENKKGGNYLILKYYRVFNAADVDGDISKLIPIAEPITPEEEDKLIEKTLLDYISREGIKLQYGGDSAYYEPAEHKIGMPQINKFQNYREYLRTLAHECGHSTGKQLSRELDTNRGNKSYMFEELIAEFTALFMAGAGKIKDNSAAYLQGWASEFKEKPTMLIKASGMAEKALNFIKGENHTVKEISQESEAA